MANEALKRRMSGIKDSRGPQGIASRGKNVYNSGSNAARTSGGPGIGRPPMDGGVPGQMAGQEELPVENGVPSIQQIVQRFQEMSAPKQLGPPGMGGIGGGMPVPEMNNQPPPMPPPPVDPMQQMMGGMPMNPMMGGMQPPPGMPNPAAIGRRLGVAR